MARAKKVAAEEGRTILFVDESAFYLLPGVAKTYAPCGKTPIIKGTCSRDHLSVISAVSPDGQLYFRIQKNAFTSVTVIAFLVQLLRAIDTPILVIWDGASIHRSKKIKEFLTHGAARRLRLETLPAYAPDLNPDEGVWNYTKNVDLANRCSSNLRELRARLCRSLRRTKRRQDVVTGFFRRASIV